MGQAGSIEQRNAIRDVITLNKNTTQDVSPQDILQALHTFCTIFPFYTNKEQRKNSTNTNEATDTTESLLDVRDRKLFDSVHALLHQFTELKDEMANEELIVAILFSMRRIIQWQELYRLGAKCLMKPFFNCLLLGPSVIIPTLDVLLRLTTMCPGSEKIENKREKEKVEKWEAANRRNFSDSGGYAVLRNLLVQFCNIYDLVRVEDVIKSKKSISSYSKSIGKPSETKLRQANVTYDKRSTIEIIQLILQIYHTTLLPREGATAAIDIPSCHQAVSGLLSARVALLQLLHHENAKIQRDTVDLVLEIFNWLDQTQVHAIQEAAREHGALLYALSFAIHTNAAKSSEDNTEEVDQFSYNLTHSFQWIELIELLCAGNPLTKTTMYRMFPVDLFLPVRAKTQPMGYNMSGMNNPHGLPESTTLVDSGGRYSISLYGSKENSLPLVKNANVTGQEIYIRSNTGSTASISTSASFKRRESFGPCEFKETLDQIRGTGEQWKAIILSLRSPPIVRPDLIWRKEMLAELKGALNLEITRLEDCRSQHLMELYENETTLNGLTQLCLTSNLKWNREIFRVDYVSISREIVVNGFFIESLIPRLADLSDSYELSDPAILAWHLYDVLQQLTSDLNDENEIEMDGFADVSEPISQKYYQSVDYKQMAIITCLRLLVRRYTKIFHAGPLPIQLLLMLLNENNRQKVSPSFLKEVLIILQVAIASPRLRNTDSITKLSLEVASVVMDTLSDSALISKLTTSKPNQVIQNIFFESKIENINSIREHDQVSNETNSIPKSSINLLGNAIASNEFDDEEHVHIQTPTDKFVRAGIDVLLIISQKYSASVTKLQTKRVFICRLLAAETLDHVTVTKILTLLVELAAISDQHGVHFSSDSSVQSPRSSAHPLSSKRDESLAHARSMSLPGLRSLSPSDRGSWKYLTLVYLLIASCDPKGSGMCVAAAEYIKHHFSNQTRSGISVSTTKGSISSSKSINASESFNDLVTEAVGMNGCGMGNLLISQLPEDFVFVFNSKKKRAADVLWGEQQRYQLFQYLKTKHLKENLTVNLTEQYASKNDEPVNTDFCVGNLFLRSYVEGDGEFLNDWTHDMYDTLVKSLFQQLLVLSKVKSPKLRSADVITEGNNLHQMESWEIQELILKSLIRLLPSRCSDVVIPDGSYATLFLPLKRSLLGRGDQLRAILALELVLAILCSSDGRSGKENRAQCRRYIENDGLEVVGQALQKMSNPSFMQLLGDNSHEEMHSHKDTQVDSDYQNPARILLYRITNVLATLSSQPSGIEAMLSHPHVIYGLLHLSQRQNIVNFAGGESVAAVCLGCLWNLCRHELIQQLTLEAGGILILIDIMVFCTDEKEPMKYNTAISATALVLQTCIGQVNIRQQSARFQSNNNPMTTDTAIEHVHQPKNNIFQQKSAKLACYEVATQLLTPSFLRLLQKSPEKFALRLQSFEDIHSPTLIWTKSMRERLSSVLTAELAKVSLAANSKMWPLWNYEHFVAADSYLYLYPELSKELIVHNVYLRTFVESHETNRAALSDEFVDLNAFSQDLLISIHSHENALNYLRLSKQQPRSNDIRKETDMIELMRQALKKLVKEDPQHNLEVSQSISSLNEATLPRVIKQESLTERPPVPYLKGFSIGSSIDLEDTILNEGGHAKDFEKEEFEIDSLNDSSVGTSTIVNNEQLATDEINIRDVLTTEIADIDRSLSMSLTDDDLIV